MFSCSSSLRLFCSRGRVFQKFNSHQQQGMLLRKSMMVMNKPLYYSTTTITITEEEAIVALPSETTETLKTPATTTSQEKKYTSTEIRLIKKQKEKVLKKEKLDEVVGKLFNVKKETESNLDNVLSEEISEVTTEKKKKRKSKKVEVKETTPVEPIKKEAFTNPQIDSLVDNILGMTIAGQASLAASADEDELISLLKTKRRQRFATNDTSSSANLGPTTYKSSIDKFSQQEVDFKQYTQTKESELSSMLEMSEDGEEDIKAPIVDPEDEDILSYLQELKDRTRKQKEEEKKSNVLDNDDDLDEEDKITEKAWKDIASKPENAAKSVEAELDEPVRQETSKSSANNSKKDDVIMQFLQDLLK